MGTSGMRIRSSRSATRRVRDAWLMATAACGLAVATAGAHASGYPERFELGTPATADDIRPLAIAIPPDGRGLPQGKGDWAAGKKVY